MNVSERWQRRTVLALVLVITMLGGMAQLGRVAGAQEATPAAADVGTPAAAPLATPVPGAQTWHVLVNNVSPDGENWSFNTFYPDHLRVHPGDAIVFSLAPNPNAFHTVMVLKQDLTPMEMYEGFAGGFVRPLDPSQPDRLQSTYFETGLAPPPCGRPDQDPCPISTAAFLEFGVSSAVLVNPPPGSDQVNTSFTVTLDPALPLGPYFFTSLVDGPTMIGWIDVVAPDQPVQSAGELAAAAQLQYEADLVWLASHDRVTNPRGGVEPGQHEDLAGRRGQWQPGQPAAVHQRVLLPSEGRARRRHGDLDEPEPGRRGPHRQRLRSHPRRHPPGSESVPAGLHDQHRRAAAAACRELPPRHLEHLPRP